MADDAPQDDQAARIRAEVDTAPPLSARQQEHLRRIFASAREEAARNAPNASEDNQHGRS